MTTPEFSRIISAARIPAAGIADTLQAKPAEREALARRFDLINIASLTAELTAALNPDETVTVHGHIAADVTQRCVVTLEPLPAHLEIPVDITFIPAEQHREGAGSPHADDIDAEFDLFTNGKIDLGEMAAQHLAVALDPYPRKPGAALAATEFGPAAAKPQPFAQLADVLKKPKTDDR